MTRKMKIMALLVSVLLVSLAAGVVFASTKGKAELPEYLGSQACLGCHSDKFVSWESSTHGDSENIVKQIQSVADLPGDPTGIAPELAEVLAKAEYYFHNRFMYKDLKTGELMYLPIEWNPTTKQYVAAPSRKGTSMDGNCGGCHAGRDFKDSTTRIEVGVGCESCHGPGRDHVLGKGDVTKIVSTTDPSAMCAGCHSGNNQNTASTRWPSGYRPGMKIEEIKSFTPIVHDPNAAPQAQHHKGAVGQWKVSGHANATNLLAEHGESYLNRQECIKCHSTAAGELIAAGGTFKASKDMVNDGVSCVACHDPHGGPNPRQLKMEAQALCLSCHSVARGGAPVAQIGTTRAPHSPEGDMVQGISAIGVAPTKGFHSDVKCVDCHMTEGNHLMKVLEPDAVTGTTRVDSCSACHKDSTPEARGVYLEMWKQTLTAKLAAVKADVDTVDAAVKANPNVLGAKKADYENARANYWYVDKDKSYGAHNFDYAMKVLTKAQKDIAAIKAGLPK